MLQRLCPGDARALVVVALALATATLMLVAAVNTARAANSQPPCSEPITIAAYPAALRVGRMYAL